MSRLGAFAAGAAKLLPGSKVGRNAFPNIQPDDFELGIDLFPDHSGYALGPVLGAFCAERPRVPSVMSAFTLGEPHDLYRWRTSGYFSRARHTPEDNLTRQNSVLADNNHVLSLLICRL